VDVRDQEVAELLREMLAEVRALREEAARQTAVLEEMLRKLDSLDRSQYG
jgi:hypothetical protein